MVSTMETPKSSAVAFANWNSRDSGEDVSNLCESDLSNRKDGRNRDLWKSDTDPDKRKRYPMNGKPGKVV